MSFISSIRISCILILAACMSSSVPTISRAASGMENTSHVRLLDGGSDSSTYLAAIEISLAPGFLTYWRVPGEAGVPPVLDWSDSQNAGDIEVNWPAPERIREADSIVYGFHDKVIIPVRVSPLRPGTVSLKLSLQYGVCKDICIPATATATVVLGGTDAGKDAVAVQRAIRTLPKPTPARSEAPLSVLSGQGLKDKGEALISVRAPTGEKPELFAEGPEGWLFTVSEGQPGVEEGTWSFLVKAEETPKKPYALVPVRLTVTAGDQSIETELRID